MALNQARRPRAVGQGKVRLGEGRCNRPLGDPTAVQEQHAVEVFGHGRQVVMHGHDGPPLVAQGVQDADDGRFGRRIDAPQRARRAG